MARKPFELRGAHVLWMLLLFFGAVIAINVAFSVIAVQSFPGEDVRRSYLQGIRYNDTLEERRTQAALGWSATAALLAEGEEAVVEVRITDARERGVEGLLIEGALRRPMNAHEDVALSFIGRGDGIYRARVPSLNQGVWELRASAHRGASRFDFGRRFEWLRPVSR
ncbi:MAG: FixH family protein [Hyphomonadaceae bacterium]